MRRSPVFGWILWVLGMLIGVPAWFLAWATFGALTDGFAVGKITVPAAIVGLLGSALVVAGLWLLRGRPRWPAIAAVVTGIVLAILAFDLSMRWHGSWLLGDLGGLQSDEHDATSLAGVWLLGIAAIGLMIGGIRMLRVGGSSVRDRPIASAAR